MKRKLEFSRLTLALINVVIGSIIVAAVGIYLSSVTLETLAFESTGLGLLIAIFELHDDEKVKSE